MYKIADFNFDIQNKFKRLKNTFIDYEVFEEKENSIINCTREEIENEKDDVFTSYCWVLELTAILRKISEWLPLNNAFLLHSVLIDVEGVGVAFAAHSGTGKTTHMNLWQELLGDKMTVVNGDKPIVRFFDDEPNQPYGYGTPWNGKEHLGTNMRTPLKHICFIERAKENSVEKIEPNDAVNAIFNQVYMPKDPVAVANTIQLINRLISSCKLWKIKCNMDISAAEIAYNTIFKEE